MLLRSVLPPMRVVFLQLSPEPPPLPPPTPLIPPPLPPAPEGGYLPPLPLPQPPTAPLANTTTDTAASALSAGPGGGGQTGVIIALGVALFVVAAIVLCGGLRRRVTSGGPRRAKTGVGGAAGMGAPDAPLPLALRGRIGDSGAFEISGATSPSSPGALVLPSGSVGGKILTSARDDSSYRDNFASYNMFHSLGNSLAGSLGMRPLMARSLKRGGATAEDASSTRPAVQLGALPARRASGTHQIVPWGEVGVLERLGKGAFGEVYECEYAHTKCALKKLHAPPAEGDAAPTAGGDGRAAGGGDGGAAGSGRLTVLLETLRAEFEVMLQLRHPHVVQLIAFASDHVSNYGILMELMEANLNDILHNDMCALRSAPASPARPPPSFLRAGVASSRRGEAIVNRACPLACTPPLPLHATRMLVLWWQVHRVQLMGGLLAHRRSGCVQGDGLPPPTRCAPLRHQGACARPPMHTSHRPSLSIPPLTLTDPHPLPN